MIFIKETKTKTKKKILKTNKTKQKSVFQVPTKINLLGWQFCWKINTEKIRKNSKVVKQMVCGGRNFRKIAQFMTARLYESSTV